MKTLIAVLTLSLGAAACGPAFEVSTPPEFVELEEEYSRYDYRATSADGLVIAAREIENESKGGAAFWLKAIKNRMRERGGYALLEELPLKSADGVPGTQLRFGHDEGSANPHLYYLSVFVTEDMIYLFEAGGTKELMTAQAAQIDASLKAFRTK